ncbi:hypothetical protein BH23PLA1_BH23PLA1_01220 [soil metagenome]
MSLRHLLVVPALVYSLTIMALAGDGNRLTYLDEMDPYYVHRDFPKLSTPQWVGEPGVEAVVILAIDDMRDSAKYEVYLRPILDRLKQIDGRAPVSIMTNTVDPEDPKFQEWLEEGLSIEAHTLTHPCPLLKDGDLDEAKRTYHECVDLLNQIPGNKPVAFRMPCCDSRNTVSPRFFTEIFNDQSQGGNYLSIDSSVFNILTPNDPDLPRELVLDPDGQERFGKYLPFPSFVNTIEDYPYPYIIGGTCWEFPCVVPSDWEAQNLQGVNNPKTVEDLKAALDAIVIKQGVFTLVFHPHGWIEAKQIVELIDHAVEAHGSKVQFLNFREALDRIEKNLVGSSLRRADGSRKGVRLVDFNHDGYLDIVHDTMRMRQWVPEDREWQDGVFPIEAGVLYATLFLPFAPHFDTVALYQTDLRMRAWRFVSGIWSDVSGIAETLKIDGQPLITGNYRGDPGVRARDIDGDGRAEVLVADANRNVILKYDDDRRDWVQVPFGLPGLARLVDAQGRDAGLRFVDLDQDGFDDVVYSNDEGFGIYLFDSIETGWSREVIAGKPDDPDALPKIVSNGENRGFWVHSRHLWWQNEDTAGLPDLVDRRSFHDLLKDVEPRAKSPEASLRSITVRPGFKVELVASEPLVMDPVAFDWGADGKLWVVEMADYPLGEDGQGKPNGRVRFLEDSNGDGIYDSSTLFLDGLNYPNGLIPWREGVLISAAPDILYAEDTTGDGRADRQEVLYTGFDEANPQHRFNGFALGLDGWLYGADATGEIRSTGADSRIKVKAMDFRIDPDRGLIEPESGGAQFGRARDDWGNWFGNNNPSLGWHYVLADQEVKRNPLLALSNARQTLDPDVHVYPTSRTLPRFNDFDHVNRITSANSPTPYRDDLFGPHFDSSLFVSEPVHNLVRRIVLEPAGTTFQGSRAIGEEASEFFASSDNWSRPTQLKTGPDGALWIADMYRFVIEHPEWIPDDWQARLDLYAGHDKGRIYRVLPVDQDPRAIPRLDSLETAELVAALDSPNGWQRDTAQRLLLHRDDRSAIAPLRELFENCERPETRVQALWVLRIFEGLDPEILMGALRDEHPEIRRHALWAGEALLADASTPVLGEALRLQEDSDPKVRFRLALALANSNATEAGQALAAIARRHADDPWFRAALLSAAPSHAGTMIGELFANAGDEPPPPALVEPLFALALLERSNDGRQDHLNALVQMVATPDLDSGRHALWQFSALIGLLDAARRAGKPLEELETGDDWQAAVEALAAVQGSARRLAGDESAPEADRLRAIRLLGRAPDQSGDDRQALGGLLRPQVPAPIQGEAVSALARINDRRVVDTLLDGWREHSPALRSAILDTLLGRREWASALLSSLEDTCVPASEVGPGHRQRLLGHSDGTLRERAAVVFGASTTTRQEVLDRYQSALEILGDPRAGKAVFEKSCIACHRLEGQGTDVGPDLTTLTDRSPEALLIAILDPNRAFESQYASYTIATTDGRVLNGIIAAESSNSITLRREEGQEDELLRADIEQMAASGQSMMPEGLEDDLSPQELADVIAYLSRFGIE